MKTVEEREQIRRAYYLEEKTGRQIADQRRWSTEDYTRELGIGETLSAAVATMGLPVLCYQVCQGESIQSG